jgi:RNA polymerase sigma-70 factor (ECF subfamily)
MEKEQPQCGKGRHLDNDRRDIIASVYTQYASDVKRYFLSYTHDVMAAEDMVQDLFMKVMDLDVIAENTTHSLIFVMARRMIIDDARHKAYVHKAKHDLMLTASCYDSYSVVRKMSCDEIRSAEQVALQRMAPKRAEVYGLFRHEELSAKEIASRMGISRRTVETHIYLSTKEVRQEVKKII